MNLVRVGEAREADVKLQGWEENEGVFTNLHRSCFPSAS